MDAIHAGGGAGEIIEYRIERSVYDPGAGTWGAWTAIDGSDRPLEQRTNYQTLSCQAFELISWRDRVRVSSRNTSGTAQTKTRLVDVAVVAENMPAPAAVDAVSRGAAE